MDVNSFYCVRLVSIEAKRRVFFYRTSNNFLYDSSIRQPLEMYCLQSPSNALVDFCPQQGGIPTKAFFVFMCYLATVLIRRRAGKFFKIF